jgi:hypothetical protein
VVAREVHLKPQAFTGPFHLVQETWRYWAMSTIVISLSPQFELFCLLISTLGSGRRYSRDIGVSSIFNGNVYYQFGDTFCFNDRDEFVGVVCNSIARVENPNDPTRSRYIKSDHQSTQDRPLPYVPLTLDEQEYEKSHSDDQGHLEKRICLWAFSGIVEISPAMGYVWYQKSIGVSLNLAYHDSD